MAIQTQLTANFSVEDATGLGGIPLQMELHPGATPVNVFYVRLYPSVNAKVVTNAGTVVKEHGEEVYIPREVVQFSGSDTGRTTYPLIRSDFVRTFNSTFDREGNTLRPSFTVDRGSLKASEAIYGAVEVGYWTTYKRLRYTASVVNGVRTLGTILAFYNGSVATFDMPIPEDTEEDLFELYRVTSRMVVNRLGAYEYPEGWTGEPTSPTFPEGTPDPLEPNEVHERVHEAGYMRASTNNVLIRQQHQPLQEPYSGGGFTPRYEVQVAKPSSNGLSVERVGSAQAQNAIEGAKTRYGIQ